jgi:hypothetical protein
LGAGVVSNIFPGVGIVKYQDIFGRVTVEWKGRQFDDGALEQRPVWHQDIADTSVVINARVELGDSAEVPLQWSKR